MISLCSLIFYSGNLISVAANLILNKFTVFVSEKVPPPTTTSSGDSSNLATYVVEHSVLCTDSHEPPF